MFVYFKPFQVNTLMTKFNFYSENFVYSEMVLSLRENYYMKLRKKK